VYLVEWLTKADQWVYKGTKGDEAMQQLAVQNRSLWDNSKSQLGGNKTGILADSSTVFFY